MIKKDNDGFAGRIENAVSWMQIGQRFLLLSYDWLGSDSPWRKQQQPRSMNAHFFNFTAN